MSGHLPLLVRWLSKVGVIPKAAVAQLDGAVAPNAQSVLDAGRLAEKTYQLLDQLGQDVVLISRMGQNLEQFGLRHSHLGFAVRNLRREEWGVVHLLNAEDGLHSGIYAEGLVNFYSDNPYRFEADVLTVPARLQPRLQQLLLETPRVVHCADYSLTSYPWSLTSQNSNQWVLEMLACAIGGIEPPTRAAAQEWLRANGYTPSTLGIKLPTQWAGPLLRDSIRFHDQPPEARRAGQVRTVTVDSVYHWLASPSGPLAQELKDVRLVSLTL